MEDTQTAKRSEDKLLLQDPRMNSLFISPVDSRLQGHLELISKAHLTSQLFCIVNSYQLKFSPFSLFEVNKMQALQDLQQRFTLCCRSTVLVLHVRHYSPCTGILHDDLENSNSLSSDWLILPPQFS